VQQKSYNLSNDWFCFTILNLRNVGLSDSDPLRTIIYWFDRAFGGDSRAVSDPGIDGLTENHLQVRQSRW
jgi:hypothetical protein